MPACTGVLYTYFLGIANYEQFQIDVSIDYLAMIIVGGLGSILGSVSRRHVRHPAADRHPCPRMEAFGGCSSSLRP